MNLTRMNVTQKAQKVTDVCNADHAEKADGADIR